MQAWLFFQFFFQQNTEVIQLMEKTLTYIKKGEDLKKKCKTFSYLLPLLHGTITHPPHGNSEHERVTE